MAKTSIPSSVILAAIAIAAFLVEPPNRTARIADAPRTAPPAARRQDRANLQATPGADAEGPSDIPAAGWWNATKRAVAGFSDDRVMALAAGVTFYVLLALFPAIASLISIYGLFADPTHLTDDLQNLSGIVPGGGIDIIKAQVTALTSSPPQALGFGVLLGFAISLWSANAGVKAFFDALNVVYHEREKRSFVRLTLISFAFTLGLIGFLILSLGAIVVVPVVMAYVGLASFTGELVAVLRWPLMVGVLTVALSLLFRYGPSRRHARWQWVSWGSAFAAIAWLAASLGFSFYVENFGSYNKTYGSLGAVVGFMTWIWVSAMVVLLGAELNAELEQQTARDSTIGNEKPPGMRGAYKADVKM